jgi:hypothetical protein
MMTQLRRRCQSGTTWCAIGIYPPVQQLAYASVARISQRIRPMQKPPLDPDVADEAPSASILTGYDEQHLVTYPAQSR